MNPQDAPIGEKGQFADVLTPREREVIDLADRSAKEAAVELGCQTKTVEVHWYHIRRKLGARNKTEAVLIHLRRAA